MGATGDFSVAPFLSHRRGVSELSACIESGKFAGGFGKRGRVEVGDDEPGHNTFT
jgi:hypothetical protein